MSDSSRKSDKDRGLSELPGFVRDAVLNSIDLDKITDVDRGIQEAVRESVQDQVVHDVTVTAEKIIINEISEELANDFRDENNSKIREKIVEAWKNSFTHKELNKGKEFKNWHPGCVRETAFWIFWDKQSKKIEFSELIEGETSEEISPNKLGISLEKMIEKLRQAFNRNKNWLLVGYLHTHPGCQLASEGNTSFRYETAADKNIIIDFIAQGFLKDEDERLRFIRRIKKGYLGVYNNDLSGVDFKDFTLAANEAERARDPSGKNRSDKREEQHAPEDEDWGDHGF